VGYQLSSGFRFFRSTTQLVGIRQLLQHGVQWLKQSKSKQLVKALWQLHEIEQFGLLETKARAYNAYRVLQNTCPGFLGNKNLTNLLQMTKLEFCCVWNLQVTL